MTGSVYELKRSIDMMKSVGGRALFSFVFALAVCWQAAAVSCNSVYAIDPTVVQFHQRIQKFNPRLAKFAEHFWDAPQVNEMVALIQKGPNQKIEFTSSGNLQVSGWFEISKQTMTVEITKVIKDGIELEKRHSGLNREFAYLMVGVLKFYHQNKQTFNVDNLQIVASYVRNPMLQNLFADMGLQPEQMVYDTMLRFSFQVQ